MQVTTEDGQLVIRLPLKQPPQPSASGKTLVVASTHGCIPSELNIDGQQVRVNATAFCYPPRVKGYQD
ncbi:MAG: hypothetical protein KTR15_07795 [Phycisphaeraceae bacterium]|nr:hypothetical protein [Phycisphaeraceae bacterium]